MDKIRKGDEVIVTTGKDKGRRGTVVLRVDADRVVVEGINRVQKATKPPPMPMPVGGAPGPAPAAGIAPQTAMPPVAAE